jgi:hypothetical protein
VVAPETQPNGTVWILRWPGSVPFDSIQEGLIQKQECDLLVRSNPGDADLPAAPAAQVALVLDDSFLHLAAWVAGPAWFEKDAVPGRFRSGLWQRDVVELFLCDLKGDGYREYHLSPGKEWWMGTFFGPRVEDPGGPWPPDRPAASGIAASVAPEGDGWRGLLSLPWALLPPGFPGACDAILDAAAGAVDLRANVTAIVGRDPRCYLSVTPLPGERPDFHQPRCFPKVVVCKAGSGTKRLPMLR